MIRSQILHPGKFILRFYFIHLFEERHPGMGIDYVEYPDCHVDDEMERGNFDVGFRIEGPKLDGEPMIIESRAFQIHQMFRKLCMRSKARG